MLKYLTYSAVLLLNACMMVGPDYHEPQKRISKQWIGSSKKKNALVKEKIAKTEQWWDIFHDPNLSAIIKKGYCNNLDLQIAGVRVLQARAQLAQVTGNLYPQQQALIGNYTYQRIGGSSLQNILPSEFETASLGFSANWEIDFWGKYRRAIQSSDASFLASIAAYDNILVTLIADIASTYISIRTFETQVRVVKQNIALQAESYNIANSRYNAGETSMLDVEQAKTTLAQTEASLPQQLFNLRQQKNRLAVLLGVTPNEVDALLSKGRGIPKPPASIEAGIPRESLFQRPDIHEARLQAMAQVAAVGATKADLFPAFSLSGTFSFSSSNIGPSSLSDLFNWSNRQVTAGPAVTWPILNYGQITNAVRVQDALYQQSILNYLNKIIQAQAEVQDYISGYILSKNALYSYKKADNSSMQAARLALVRYKEGEASYTTVLDSERQQLQVQTSYVTARGEVLQNVVGLYRSLGGGWQIRKCKDIVPYRIKEEMAARTNWGSLLMPEQHLKPVTKWQAFKQSYIPSW